MLTGVELAPRPAMAVAGFAFSVDTVAPRPPSQPSLEDFSDSGVRGDGITKFGMVSLSGTADRGDRVQIYRENGAVVAGTTTDASGHWAATTSNLPDGTYTLSAVTIDKAGNKSARTSGMRLVVDSVAPAVPGAPALGGAGADGRVVVSGVAGDDVARIVVYTDGAQFGSVAPGADHTWRFTLPALDPGSYSVTVAAADAADNFSTRSAPLTVTVAPPPPPDSSRPAAAGSAAGDVTPGEHCAGDGAAGPPRRSSCRRRPGAGPTPPPASEARPAPPGGPLPDGPRPPPPRRVPSRHATADGSSRVSRSLRARSPLPRSP